MKPIIKPLLIILFILLTNQLQANVDVLEAVGVKEVLLDSNNPISIIIHDESIDTPLSIQTNNESYFYQRDHPDVPTPKNWTPKVPSPHDHYYYPKGK